MSELAHLGEPYYSNKKKGTGLGLMVTFRIIEAMNGSIQFQSRKGEGTEVIVKLPSAAKK
ncbi:Sporulation kinase E [compost metagenome]